MLHLLYYIIKIQAKLITRLSWSLFRNSIIIKKIFGHFSEEICRSLSSIVTYLWPIELYHHYKLWIFSWTKSYKRSSSTSWSSFISSSKCYLWSSGLPCNWVSFYTTIFCHSSINSIYQHSCNDFRSRWFYYSMGDFLLMLYDFSIWKLDFLDNSWFYKYSSISYCAIGWCHL